MLFRGHWARRIMHGKDGGCTIPTTIIGALGAGRVTGNMAGKPMTKLLADRANRQQCSVEEIPDTETVANPLPRSSRRDGPLLFEQIVSMDGIVCMRKDSRCKVTEKPRVRNPVVLDFQDRLPISLTLVGGL